MSISILQLLNDNRRADLVAALTKETALSTQTAGATIDALVPTAIAHLLAKFKSGGVETALSLLSNESSEANWPSFDRAGVANHLAQDHGVSADNANLAIGKVITATKAEVTGLLANHSLSDLLNAQAQYLEGKTPEWGFSLNGLSDMAGKGLAMGAAALASAGAIAAGAADTVTDVAAKAASKVSDVAGDAIDAVGDTAGIMADLASDAAGKVTDLAGDAASKVGGLAAAGIGAAGAAAAGLGKGLGNAGGAAVNAAGDVAGAGGGILRKLLPLLVLALLALLALFGWKQCQTGKQAIVTDVAAQQTEPVATQVAAAQAALFNLDAANGNLITATVGTEAGKVLLLEAITAKFGPEVTAKAIITVDAAYDDNFPMGLGIASPAAPIADQVSQSAAATGNAMASLVPGTATAQQLADALNLNIINFAMGKADIPAENQEVLKQAAATIAKMNVALNITGHTDNTGDEAANVALSQARANAVKAFLEANGAPAGLLMAKGVGASMPKADNTTLEGRIANRRIEYTAK